MDQLSVESLARDLMRHGTIKDDGGLVCMRSMIRSALGVGLRIDANVIRAEVGCWDGRWMISMSPILIASPKEERFALAHEIAEWSLRDQEVREVEMVCDAIARALVIPDIAFSETGEDVTDAAVDAISDQYEAPKRHVRIRAREVASTFPAEATSGVFLAHTGDRMPLRLGRTA